MKWDRLSHRTCIYVAGLEARGRNARQLWRKVESVSRAVERAREDPKHLEYLGVSLYDLHLICILIWKFFSLIDTDDSSLLGKKDDGLQYRPDVKGTKSWLLKFWLIIEMLSLAVLGNSVSITTTFPTLLYVAIYIIQWLLIILTEIAEVPLNLQKMLFF